MKQLRNKVLTALNKVDNIKGQPGLNNLFFESLPESTRNKLRRARKELESLLYSIDSEISRKK